MGQSLEETINVLTLFLPQIAAHERLGGVWAGMVLKDQLVLLPAVIGSGNPRAVISAHGRPWGHKGSRTARINYSGAPVFAPAETRDKAGLYKGVIAIDFACDAPDEFPWVTLSVSRLFVQLTPGEVVAGEARWGPAKESVLNEVAVWPTSGVRLEQPNPSRLAVSGLWLHAACQEVYADSVVEIHPKEWTRRRTAPR